MKPGEVKLSWGKQEWNVPSKSTKSYIQVTSKPEATLSFLGKQLPEPETTSSERHHKHIKLQTTKKLNAQQKMNQHEIMTMNTNNHASRRVSFGSVATVEYNINSHAAQSLAHGAPKTQSVEDFEQVRYSHLYRPRHGTHGAVVMAEEQEADAFEERSHRIDELLLRIEETMNATEAAIRGDDDPSASLSKPSKRKMMVPHNPITDGAPYHRQSLHASSKLPLNVGLKNEFFSDTQYVSLPPKPPVRQRST